jgi:hypothetical protein
MNEAEWLACTDPHKMLKHVRGRATPRKLRLFAVACCRSVWDLLDDPVFRQTVETAERFADGEATEADLEAARAAAWEATADAAGGAAGDAAWGVSLADAWGAAMQAAGNAAWARGPAQSRGPQVALVRDLFGNPIRPVAVSPAWRTAQVVALAQAAYDNRTLPAGTLEPARLAVLADALEDAGCDNAELLGHLRGEGPHVRGCWVVDLLTGRA